MGFKTLVACAVIGTIVAAASVIEPAQAGTCSPVKAMGQAKNIVSATARAQDRLQKIAARMGGTVTETSTDCIPRPAGYVCTIKAIVCPEIG